MMEEYQDVYGFAVVLDKQIVINSVRESRRAAQFYGLSLVGVSVSADYDDEKIDGLWKTNRGFHGLDLMPVTVGARYQTAA